VGEASAVGMDNSATPVRAGNSGEGCCVGVGEGCCVGVSEGWCVGVGEGGMGVVVGNAKGPQASITINSTKRLRKRILIFMIGSLSERRPGKLGLLYF